MAVSDDLARYQQIRRPFARGEGGVIAITPPTGNTSDAAGYTLAVEAGSTKGGSDITGITAAVNATTTQIDVTVPEATTMQVTPPTTASGTYGPQPMAYIYCTLWRTDGTDAVLARFALGVYDGEGAE